MPVNVSEPSSATVCDPGTVTTGGSLNTAMVIVTVLSALSRPAASTAL